MYKKLIILATLFICFSANIFARHIIGGIITYSYISDGKYKFTMKIYRDCAGGGAAFDGDSGDNTPPQAAVIGFFKENNGVFQNIGGTQVKLLSKKLIDPPTYPCLASPPSACVEEGIYEFEWTIPNFDANATYHVVYQRCCRNNTITNIVNAKDVGATYTVAITPAAIKAKSSSPVFNNFPPTIICSPIPFNFDHSAKDIDGDSLVYKMCSPLEGGGPDLSNAGASNCDGVRPNPTCPPPFSDVKFSSGFNALQPLGASANLSLDIVTGKLYLVPQNIGQYVVGVCVEEYRKGILLSKTFRDFQFNVGACQALVTAGIAAADTLVFQKKYIVRSCGSSDVTFVNGSTQEKFINSYLWSFDINGQKVTSNDKNPTIKFPGVGKYVGTLILNLNQKPCTDTAKLEVGIFPGIDANFKYVYDTCIAAPIQFTNLSTSGSGQITKYEWDFKDGKKDNVKDPLHEYKIPGNFKVKLKVTDVNLCTDTITKPILYYPVPPLLVVNPDTGVGCTPFTLRINNLSYPIDKTYTIDWDMGDGTKSSEISPVKTYDKVGIYSLNLKLTSPIGCKTQASFPNIVEVKQSPTAMFSFTPEKLNSLQNLAQFTDKSLGASKWSWQFGQGEGGSSSRNPSYAFKDTGIHVIRLIVSHPSGCRDTSFQTTDVEPVIKFFMPNAFTPNYDSTNDDFKGKGITDGITNFQMLIFNRWGERVFETKNYDEGWNGRKNNVGELAPEGVYIYTISFTGPRNKLFTYKGFATLLR
jgi:gliding motility-associated-like protein